MRSDHEIQQDVQHEFEWEPNLQHEDIAIAVRGGVVTLAGFAKSYADKLMAERLAGRIKDVKAIANDIEVRLLSSWLRPDPEIARAALDALKWHISVPNERIKVTVAQGTVTLTGDVEWFYQKEAAEDAVRMLTGVQGVSNLVAVKARPTSADVKKKIKEALHRGAEFEADQITVDIDGGKAILRGTVRAYAERRDAERAAWNAPSVTDVDNRLTVEPHAFAAV